MSEVTNAKDFSRWEMPRSNRSRLNPTPTFKTAVAGTALLAIQSGLDPKQVALWMRRELRRQWTFMSACQYLAGKEARAAIEALPEGFLFEGIDVDDLRTACLLSAVVLAEMDIKAGRTWSPIELVSAVRAGLEGEEISEKGRAAILVLIEKMA